MGEWLIEPDALEAEVEVVLDWCRETLAHSRRPWGIDAFDLAVAVGAGTGSPRSTSFKQLCPADCYDAEALARRLASFLETAVADARAPLMLAVALFSWGDAAHTALPETA